MLAAMPSMGIARETTGISTIKAMAAKASHATNRCCAARFTTRISLMLPSLEQAPDMMTATVENVMWHAAAQQHFAGSHAGG